MNADPQARDRLVRRVIVIEGSANLLILLVKAIVGLATGSLAVLGDAIHSLTDLANNAVAWIVVRFASMPPDREHPYGHRKFETLAVFGLAALLVVLAFELAARALHREEHAVTWSGWELALMFGVLVVNVTLASWQWRWALRLSSDILRADARHTFADVLTTIVVIAGWQLSAHGYRWLDKICALGIAVLVLFLAYGLFRRAIPVLVGHIAIEPDVLREAVCSVPGVRTVRRIRSRWEGSARAVDMIVTVEPGLPTSDSHAIADAIETLLEKRFSVEDVTIHVEPDQ